MENSKGSMRQSNIELMRIVCILLIVAHHYVVHGGALSIQNLGEKNRIMLYMVSIWPRVAINCFILVTGYFGSELSDKKILSHLKKLWVDRWLYSMGALCFIIFLTGEIALDSTLESIFPILFSKHNYVTSFFILYIFIPFINKVTKNFPQKEFRNLLICGGIFFSLIPTCLSWTNTYFDEIYTDNTYSYVLWMIFIYLLGTYLKKYRIDLPWKRITPIILLGMLLIGVLVEGMYQIVPFGYYTNTQNGFVVLVVSVCLFHFFLGLDIKHSKVINSLAASSFAVLLIHDDPLIRYTLWDKVFSYVDVTNLKWLCVHMIFSVVTIYTMCILIDKIYICIKKFCVQQIQRC